MSVSRKEWFEGIAALRCALVLALGAPLLGGCAAGHVGNAWQCPLIQVQPCVSVADADPAGAGAQGTGARDGNIEAARNTADRPVPGSEAPLYRAAPAEDRAHDRTAQPSRTGCRGGCRPFAWLRRLGRHGTEALPEPDVGEADTGAAGEPVEMPRTDTPAVVDLRTPEVVGRIWIAPYVDALGVYHEASWVRVVFEPAGWKHP